MIVESNFGRLKIRKSIKRINYYDSEVRSQSKRSFKLTQTDWFSQALFSRVEKNWHFGIVDLCNSMVFYFFTRINFCKWRATLKKQRLKKVMSRGFIIPKINESNFVNTTPFLEISKHFQRTNFREIRLSHNIHKHNIFSNLSKVFKIYRMWKTFFM